jgi:fluoride exporter
MSPPRDPDPDPPASPTDERKHVDDGWEDLPVDPDIDVGAGPTPIRRRRRPSGRADSRVLFAISLGAMGGATARYKLATWITVPAGGFPWATFWTNVSGSFVLGVLLVLLIERFPPTRYARAFAGTGFLGAYTTFSTFSVETDVLIKDGHFAVAAAYVVSSLLLGIAVAWLGVVLGRLVPHQRLAWKEHP